MEAQRTIYVLMVDAFGRGGVARATLRLANRLAEHHRVEVISLYRRHDRPLFPIDARVRLTVLRDTRAHEGLVRTTLHRQRTRLQTEPAETQMSLLTDLLLRRALGRLGPGVLLSTRPSLHLAATRFAPAHVRVVGQDHAPYGVRFDDPRQAEVLRATLPRLDACTVLTEADATAYRTTFPEVADRVVRVPHMLSWPVAGQPAPLTGPVVVAAGRLSKEKGFRRLVRSFAAVADEHPDWRLVIHGEGGERAELTALVGRLGLEDRVSMPGHTDDLRAALERAAVFALSCHYEGSGMALVETMSLGVPAVSFDCPRGPREILDHGRTGLLVEDGDLVSFAAALSRLMGDPELRRRLGRNALAAATAYDPEQVLARWEELFDQLGRRPLAAPS